MSPSGSISLANRLDAPPVVTVTVPASFTLRVSLTVVGLSLTGLIVIVTVTVFPLIKPSLAA